MANHEGYFTSLNAAWEDVLGWSRDELLSRRFIDFVHPEDVERTAREAAAATRPDHHIVDFENRYRHKNGDYRWLRWSARSDGEQWLAVAFDITERKHSEERLRGLLTAEHLLAYSQPIMGLRSSALSREELLVRLRIKGSILPPAEFLPDAERLGLIGLVDTWMVRQALRLAAQDRLLHVNLSARTIGDADLVGEIEQAVGAAGASAPRLTFEITETAALEHLDAAREFVQRLLPLGCKFALDDFGTGFGSLTYLRHLPLQFLKIDTAFVRHLTHEYEDRALVRSVVALAGELGLETVAEGVEDRATLELVRRFGVDHVQGYAIGRPSPVTGSTQHTER